MEVGVRFSEDINGINPVEIGHIVEMCIAEIVKAEEYTGPATEVGVYFCGDDEIRELNFTYRGIDTPTDVLSFPMNEPASGEDIADLENLLGDIVISVETAYRQASAFDESIQEEIARLVSHGMLHLLDYDDSTPEQDDIMAEKQESIVRKVLEI